MALRDGRSFELGTDGPTSILVGVDGSPSSIRAAAWAAGMARRNGAHLVAVYVQQVSAMAAQLPAAAGAVAQTEDELRTQIHDQLAEGARHHNVQLQFVARTGNPYRELFAVAEEHRVEVVVIGSSSHSGRRFVGSLAARLVRDAIWPIMVVP